MSETVVQETKRFVSIKKIPERLAVYTALVQEAEACFILKDKNLEEACKEHAQNLMLYDIMNQECKTIEDTVKAKIDEVEGKLYVKYNENSQRVLSQRDIGQYIKGDPEYVAAYEILLEVSHIKRQLESIVEALRSMAFSLNNIVKLRVAQLEDVTL